MTASPICDLLSIGVGGISSCSRGNGLFLSVGFALWTRSALRFGRATLTSCTS